MSVVGWLLQLFAAVVVVGLVGRASAKLVRNPDADHDELVPEWERRATTVAGVPLTLVGLSTMVGGPLAVPYNALMLALPGIVLLVYPNFTPSL